MLHFLLRICLQLWLDEYQVYKSKIFQGEVPQTPVAGGGHCHWATCQCPYRAQHPALLQSQLELCYALMLRKSILFSILRTHTFGLGLIDVQASESQDSHMLNCKKITEYTETRAPLGRALYARRTFAVVLNADCNQNGI